MNIHTYTITFYLTLFFSLINANEIQEMIHAEMQTSKGIILLSLEFEKTPLTVANFIGLAEGTIANSAKPQGVPFYNGLKFHRVIENFMIQGGCPQGNGRGNPGYKFADEFHPNLTHSGSGILSMANSGPGSNGSQFFITHIETPWLDNKHTVFGNVIKGQDVVDQIEQDDIIESIAIIRVGEKAEQFNAKDIFESEQKRLNKIIQEQTTQLQKEIDEILGNNAIETSTGLQYTIINEGIGATAKAGDIVSVHYSGYLMDGTKFDSSYDNNKPIQFPLGKRKVIAGWEEGIALLNIGAKAKFVIPPHLAYGPGGRGNIIPANATLIFDVELLDIQDAHHGHDHSDPNHRH